MANKRKITIFFSSEGTEKEIETDVRSFGELIALVSDYNLSSKKVVDSETRHVFETDEAILPEGDCVLYIYNKKSKAGAKQSVPKEFKKISVDKLHTFPLDLLRKLAVHLNKTYTAGIKSKAPKEELQSNLRKWMISNAWPESVATSSVGKPSKGVEKFEANVTEKVKGGKVRADVGQVVQSVSNVIVKKGAATLDIISDKLDIILERMDIKQGVTAHPRPNTSEERRRDAANLKNQLPGLG